MAKILDFSLLLILLFVSAAASRTKIYSNNNNEDFHATDGICKTMVEKQGYACQEHLVSLTVVLMEY